MKKTAVRKEELLSALTQRGKMSIKEISERFDISLPTARRMCSQLFESGLVLRTHGGIRHLPEIKSNYSFDKLMMQNSQEKVRIAQFAATLVSDNQVIFLESGTTIRELAIALAERIHNKQLSKIMVFTNSLINLKILSSVCDVVMIGGLFREERQDFIGYFSERIIRGLRFDYCFIGADAINLQDGMMALDSDTVHFDELLVSRSARLVVLAHSAKFSSHSLISYASINDAYMFVTDSGLPEETAKAYENAGAKIVCV